jgi:hypothetical protein
MTIYEIALEPCSWTADARRRPVDYKPRDAGNPDAQLGDWISIEDFWERESERHPERIEELSCYDLPPVDIKGDWRYYRHADGTVCAIAEGADEAKVAGEGKKVDHKHLRQLLGENPERLAEYIDPDDLDQFFGEKDVLKKAVEKRGGGDL